LRARLLIGVAGLTLGVTAAQAQTITLTSPTNGARIDLNQTGNNIEVTWDYTGPGTPVGFSLWVNGANIGNSCSFAGGSGSCFFDATDTVCSPVLQILGSFVLPNGTKFSSPIQVFFYRGNDPTTLSCLPTPPQCAGDQAGGSVGGPINVVTGNMHYEAVDIEVPSPLPIRISRRYDTQRSYSGPMGVGFRHRYDTRMECGTDPNGLGQNCKYTDAENNVTYRGKTATGFTPAWYSIANDSFNGSQLTEPYQTKYNYTGTTLSSIQDRNGNSLTFVYDGGGKLMTITDTFGRQVTFGYTGTLVTSITRPDGRQIGYGYTSGRLTSVELPRF
jgi:YD repeat-containing protein